MKKFYALLLLLVTVCVTPNLKASDFADQWNWRHPYPSANSLTVTVSKANYLAIGGANGYVSVSKDKGATWEPITLKTNEEIAAVNLNYYPGKVIAITKSGLIFDSEGQSLGSTSIAVNNFAFDGAGTKMWIVGDGGKLAYSSNGTSWSQKQVSTGGGNITSIYFFGTDGWLTTDNGKIFRSSNNGDSWIEQTTGFTAPIFDVYFVDAQNGWAVCDGGKVLHTVNGGTTWSQQTTTSLYSLNSCYFESASIGWISGKYGSIFHTADGGTTWEKIQIENLYGDLNSSARIAEKLFFSGSNGEIVEGITSSNSFSLISYNLASFNLRSIASYGEQVLAVGDNGGILLSFNKGKDWTKITNDYSQRINACQYFNADTAYFVTQDGKLFRSPNGGKTWKQKSLDNDKEFHAISCNGSAGAVVGFKSTIYITRNCGKDWSQAIALTTSPIEFFGVHYTGDKGWACGTGGGIVKTTDGGETWENIAPITTETLNAIYVSGNIGYSVGKAGTVLKTTDAGASWSKITFPNSSELTAVYLSEDGTKVLITGKNGVIYSSTDGNTWNKIQLSATQHIYGLCGMIENSTFSAWICGEGGMIMSHNVGASSVQDFTQRNDIKIDLYPNPTYNVVSIKNTAELANVNLVQFYNLLGDKVLEFPVTNNSNYYEFNVESLNSGIYIVKLYSNTESYSVRMIKE